jgi:hypothetical protein
MWISRWRRLTINKWVEAQGGLHLHHLTIHHLCTYNLLAQLSKTASAKKILSMIQRHACLVITGVMPAIPLSAMEKPLTRLHQLDLVFQGEVRSAKHPLCSLRCWSYFTPLEGIAVYWWSFISEIPYLYGGWCWGQHIILKSSTGLLMLAKEEWTRGPGTSSAVRGLAWYTNASGMGGGGEPVMRPPRSSKF